MVIVIGTDYEDAKGICEFLIQNGIVAEAQSAQSLNSLTALVISRKKITGIVLLQGTEANWSMGHILAAARQLNGKGSVLCLSPQNKPPALIGVAEDREELLRLLTQSGKKDSGGSAGGGAKAAPVAKHTWPPVRPMKIPMGKILFLGVVGAQRRIGCTTQSVGLWHYCKALGFDPAVVSSKEQIAQIAAPMRCEEIPAGYRIEGIPFVADTALSYDCYILDIGAGSIMEALQVVDSLILIAGSKPWEIQNTAAALQKAKGQTMPVLLSFASEADANSLKPLFGRQPVMVMPWMPELWQPSEEALAKYDSVLRPFLEKALSKSEQQAENDLQLQKGGE